MSLVPGLTLALEGTKTEFIVGEIVPIVLGTIRFLRTTVDIIDPNGSILVHYIVPRKILRKGTTLGYMLPATAVSGQYTIEAAAKFLLRSVDEVAIVFYVL